MSSSRRLPTSYNTSTYGGSGLGRDYTSLSAWEADTDIDLITATDGEVLECYDDEDFDDSVTLSGATASSDYFRVIKPADGEGHNGTPNSGLTFSTTDGPIIHLAESYAQAHDIIGIMNANSGTGKFAFFVNGDGSGRNLLGFIGCIAKATNAGAGEASGFRFTARSPNYVFAINCIGIDCKSYSFIATYCSWLYYAYTYNCTSINAGVYGFYGYYEEYETVHLICKNCISDGSGNADYNNTTNTTCLDSNDNITFINSGSDDYHLSINSRDGIGDGTDLSSDGVYSFDDDIDGTTIINNWNIGFDWFLVWSGKLLGVSNPKKINGVNVANIAMVNGI